MSSYEFVTVWEFDAPLEDVWAIIEDADSWPAWWRGMLSNLELRPGNDSGVGSIRHSRWKSILPYTLAFDTVVVRSQKHSLIEIEAFGELEGIGKWLFDEIAPHRTRVTYDWRVSTSKWWMNAIAPLARPFFRWNHDVIMRWGEEGLRRRLARGSDDLPTSTPN